MSDTSPLAAQLQAKLKLSRIESLSWLSKGRVRSCSRPEGVVGYSEVRAIEKIETFGDQINFWHGSPCRAWIGGDS